MTVFLFGPGDIFGFLPFLDGGAYPGCAQAIEDVEAQVLPRTALHQALRTDPELAVPLITLLGRRLRSAMDLIQGLSTPGVQARVATALLALAPNHGGPAPIFISLPVTTQGFAGALGVAPETFSRALTHLESHGTLVCEGPGRYRVADLHALQQVAGGKPA